MKYLNISLSITAIIAVVILYFITTQNEETPKLTASKTNTIAYIDSDTLWAKYEFAKDITKKITSFDKESQNKYQEKAKAFELAYNNYVRKVQAGLLSANDQQRMSQQLGLQQEELVQLNQKLSMQLTDTSRSLNSMVQDTILSFLEKYNKKAGFAYILYYTKGGTVLIADKKLDITEDVLKKLNKEYQSFKKD